MTKAAQTKFQALSPLFTVSAGAAAGVAAGAAVAAGVAAGAAVCVVAGAELGAAVSHQAGLARPNAPTSARIANMRFVLGISLKESCPVIRTDQGLLNLGAGQDVSLTWDLFRRKRANPEKCAKQGIPRRFAPISGACTRNCALL